MKLWLVALALLTALMMLGSMAGCKFLEDRGRSTDADDGVSPVVSTRQRPPAVVDEEEPVVDEATPDAETDEADVEGEEPGSEGAEDADESEAPDDGVSDESDVDASEETATEDAEATPAPPTASVEDHLLSQCVPDLAIALEHVRKATESAAAGKLADASAEVADTELALGFARCELPSVLVRQNLARAISRIQKGDSAGAEEALNSAVTLALEVELEGSLREFRKAANSALDLIAKNSGTTALEEISGMVEAVRVDAAEETLAVIGEHLLGARQALDRGVGPVAEAELKEARGKLLSLLEEIGEG